MQFNQDHDAAAYTVRSYSTGEINILAPTERQSGQTAAQQHYAITTSFIMTPHCLIEDWPPKSVAQLCGDDLKMVAELAPEVVVLGTGDTLRFPDSQLTIELMIQGIGVEVMATPAACRTYNILVNEGRNVALAMML